MSNLGISQVRIQKKLAFVEFPKSEVRGRAENRSSTVADRLQVVHRPGNSLLQGRQKV